MPAYISSVVIPVWTDKNNQDDIQWIPATKQLDF
ncbi:GBS Bsp-like repeat-containing protein [Streptococcus mutans]|nr:GBS Bsp-like repeat-containing protein [Streptococcus mutans]